MLQQSKEERDVALQQALAARLKMSEECKANEHLYKLSYMDSNYWQDLATTYKLRMPTYNVPCTVKGMRKYLRRLDIDCKQWLEYCGLNKLQQFIDLNPKYTLYAFAGNALEYKVSG